jgi:hypothetical protein
MQNQLPDTSLELLLASFIAEDLGIEEAFLSVLHDDTEQRKQAS